MSFPASGLETTYRNNLREVAKMLQTNHGDKFMVSFSFPFYAFFPYLFFVYWKYFFII